MEFVIGKMITNQETTVLVDVPPATPENLAALRNRFEKELDRPDITPERVKYIEECVIYTRHKELSYVALRLFDYPAPCFCYRLLEQVYRSRPDPGEANALLLAYVARPDSLRPLIPFGYTWWNEGTFGDKQIQTLRETKNPWVRLATYVTFPKQCPDPWKADVRTELSNLPHLPAAVEEIRRLDDRDFAVREKATTKLRNLEIMAEPAIRAHLKANPSPESRRRCEQILAEWERHPTNFNVGNAFTVLENAPGPEGKEILAILAKGPADCRLVQRARESLERLAPATKGPR